MQELEDVYRLIDPQLKRLEELARESLGSIDPFVEEVVRYSFRFGGKRLRPVILLLVGKTLGTLTENHCRAATAIELIHTASLIHDDILDGASIRRHLTTVNVRWNAQVGVLAGDILLTKALELLIQGCDMLDLRTVTEACRKTCEGELRQLGTSGRFEMTRDEYFEMIAGKTSPLLACSAELGAYHSGADEATIGLFREFGQKLGLAFQVIDDVLDLVGETDTAGKTLRTDLANRKPTLPLILYLESADQTQRTKILNLLRCKDFDENTAVEIVRRLEESGTIDASRKMAERLIDEAVKSISVCSGNAESLAGLVTIARFVGNRTK